MTAARTEVLETIRSVLATVLDRELPETTEDTRLLDGLGLDSTRVLELLMELEDALSLEFDIDALEQRDVESLGSLADFVELTQARG